MNTIIDKLIQNTTIILLLVSTSIGFTACDDILEVDNTDQIPTEVALSSITAVESHQRGMYSLIQLADVLGGNTIAAAEFFADDAEVDESRLSNFGTLEIYTQNTSIQLYYLRNMWLNTYRAINAANSTINVLTNGSLENDPEFESKKDFLIGDAYFVKGMLTHQLNNLWGLPYNIDNPSENSTNLGVVLRTEASLSLDQDFAKARASVEATYNQIISDLENAETYLTNAGINTSARYASSTAAKAYLARVHLEMGNYQAAADKAEEVIESNLFPLDDSNDDENFDFRSIFSNSGSGKAPQVIYQAYYPGGVDNSNSSLRGYYSSNVFYTFYANTLLWNSYLGDLRANQWYTLGSGNRILITKWDRPPSEFYHLPIIRIAEMYLTRAEALLRLNEADPSGVALSDYNAIRARAKPNYNPASSVTYNKVLQERRRELAFEGDRYRTLRRTGQSLRFGTDPFSTGYLFKIPQEEIAGNPLVQQNGN